MRGRGTWARGWGTVNLIGPGERRAERRCPVVSSHISASTASPSAPRRPAPPHIHFRYSNALPSSTSANKKLLLLEFPPFFRRTRASSEAAPSRY